MPGMSTRSRLILASGSPRRRLLLSMAGYEFTVMAPDIPEVRNEGEPAEDFVVRLAQEKARAVAGSQPEGACVLGFDTAVVLDDRIYGKPASEAEAAEMLLSLAGRTHVVLTGYCMVMAGSNTQEQGVDAARVTMKAVSADTAADYAATGEPMDKAGGYALQGRGGGFVDSVEGLKSTVIGLPLEHVIDMLTRQGIMPAGGALHEV